MKPTALAVLAMSLTLAHAGRLAAQVKSPKEEMDRCVRWVEANATPSLMDPVAFCSGREDEQRIGGWYTSVCPNSGGYCQAIGRVMKADTLGISVRTPSKDGHEFLSPSKDAVRPNVQSVDATLYSRTDFSIGDLKLKAGIYKLIPRHEAPGWRFTIVKSGGDSEKESALHDSIGTVDAKPIALDVAPMDTLRIQIYPMARNCPGPRLTLEFRELEFSFAGTDVALCIQPDQVAPVTADQLSQR